MVFDRSKLRLKPLKDRIHDLTIDVIMPLDKRAVDNMYLGAVAKRIIAARQGGSPVILMMGGHVIRSGAQRFIIDMLEKGFVSCVATNGSGIIHDYELALIGATTESVARYIRDGQFGLWMETSQLNDIINSAYKEGSLGMGEAVGRAVEEGNYPEKDISIAAACYRLGIPFTVHVGIGYDIIHEHPNFDGASAGATSYTDFLRFADTVSNLDGGVIMNFGSAVMAPEVFLKALSMARNVAHQEGRSIRRFTSLVCDLYDLPSTYSAEPPKHCNTYYFRPIKTMLVRTVADGGESYYVKGRHAETIPQLWSALQKEAEA